MILLTAQSQTAAGQMSVLGQPAVQEVLESLVCSEKTVPDPYSVLGLALGSEQAVKPSQSQSQSQSPPPVIANNLNMLSNTSSLNQLLGLLSRQPSKPQTTAATTGTTQQQQQQQQQQQPPPTSQQDTVQPVRPSLMSVPPPPTPQQHHQQQQQQQLHQQQQQLQQQQLLQQHHQLVQQQQQQVLQAQLAAVGQLQGGVYQPVMLGGLPGLPGLNCTGPPPAPFFVHPASVGGVGGVGYPAHHLPLQSLQPLVPMSLVPPNALDLQLPALTSPLSHSPVPRISASSPATTISSTPSPISLKRKASIPPSPEVSPQGPYIGQHSQGLGGHYADSYWAKKRLKQSF